MQFGSRTLRTLLFVPLFLYAMLLKLRSLLLGIFLLLLSLIPIPRLSQWCPPAIAIFDGLLAITAGIAFYVLILWAFAGENDANEKEGEENSNLNHTFKQTMRYLDRARGVKEMPRPMVSVAETGMYHGRMYQRSEEADDGKRSAADTGSGNRATEQRLGELDAQVNVLRRTLDWTMEPWNNGISVVEAVSDNETSEQRSEEADVGIGCAADAGSASRAMEQRLGELDALIRSTADAVLEEADEQRKSFSESVMPFFQKENLIGLKYTI